jgi:hypothetical protein
VITEAHVRGEDAVPYFDDNTPWYAAFNSGQFPQAVAIGLDQLNRTRTTATYAAPKGTPFYFMGIAAFASHDYQTATFFFDAAVAEDVRHYPGDNDKPALMFMRLDKTREAAAQQIVDIVGVKLDAALKGYAARQGSKSLTLNDVRDHFLNHLERLHLRTLTTAFISFLAEWDYRLQMIDLAPDVSREPFFTHLFRGCLLFESLLKEKASKSFKRKTLAPLIDDHLRTLLTIGKQIKTKSPGLEAILRQLKPKQKMRTAVQCTAQTRNTLGHNLVWAATSLDRRNYDLLAHNIAASCLHTIACLYVPQKKVARRLPRARP